MEGYLRPEQYPALTVEDRLAIERCAFLTGIGPIFDQRPPHHGQHDYCCGDCNAYRTRAGLKRNIKQPWAAIELPDAA